MIAGIIAWVVGKGVVGWLAELIVYGVLALGLIGGTALAWHTYVAKPYYVRGVNDGIAKQKKLDAPIIAKLTGERDQALAANNTLQASVATLTRNISDQNASMAQLRVLADRARAQAKAALASVQAQVKRDADEIARLTAVANGPAVADACARATDYLTQLAVWRRGS
jgi:hypothetical protein